MIGGVELMEMKGAAMDNKRISEIVEEEMMKQDANRYRDMRKTLTITKSIADIIDGYCKHNFTADRLIMMAYRDYQEFNDWIIKDWVKNDNIARAYLAGKALGVDLVKVVEG